MPKPAEPGVVDIDVPDIPEPDEPEQGRMDPDDTYTEGPGVLPEQER